MFAIYVEDKGEETTQAIDNALGHWQIDGATILRGVGYWQGQKEGCAVVQIDNVMPTQVRLMAEELKIVLKQQAVMIVEMAAMVEMV